MNLIKKIHHHPNWLHRGDFFQKLVEPQIVKKFSAFYWNWRFFTAISRFHQLFVSWTKLVQAKPCHVISILIVPSNLHPRQPIGLFPSDFPTKIPYAFLFSPVCATGLIHPIFFDFVTIIMFGEYYTTLTVIFLRCALFSVTYGFNFCEWCRFCSVFNLANAW